MEVYPAHWYLVVNQRWPRPRIRSRLTVVASASEPWPRPRSYGIGLGIDILASFNITKVMLSLNITLVMLNEAKMSRPRQVAVEQRANFGIYPDPSPEQMSSWSRETPIPKFVAQISYLARMQACHRLIIIIIIIIYYYYASRQHIQKYIHSIKTYNHIDKNIQQNIQNLTNKRLQ